ncbi:hypothetical protein FNSP10_15600 [Fusobacterium nucleatum]|jgi:phage major capsid protein E|uniref:Major capsid protein E n=1 Tax=Fusobacterium animalis D11 TaxID=556264 RepID=D6BE00_9FUSO|nr:MULTISPECIES: major capsid protein [Fusobacterium]EFD80397.1 hypothetical protein PSAG_00432 [Fusobacterium animalis D11]EGN65219.1 hypothetical protein HMPREF0404_00593 [Fusobacterium animalis 21_1A]MCL4585504.1 hypothetical protein [Fusobacterium nucleatum YWH7055]BEO96015.1 hypothetical protein FNCP10_08700 [Fusobacterium nucleatum]BEP08186.1 hypothetical protein FNSP10_15600 [Fusobacterium nucleatum]
MLGLYTPKTIRKVRENVEVKRNFLTELFFKKGTPVPTEEIILEYTKAGEAVAPYLTPLEAGRPVYSRSKKSNVIIAPSIGPEYSLTPKDMFIREAGQPIENYNPAKMVGEKIGRVLLDQENYITNKIELMVSQFLTTGIVKSGDKEAEYEVNYELGNKITLDSTHKWGAAGVEPLFSLEEMIKKGEENGLKTENIILGSKAAQLLRKSEEFKKAISKDLQNEFVKKVLRIHPGVIWLGTYTTYGVELFSYSRKVIGVDGKSIQLMPTNMVVGGASQGEILYAPIVFMSEGIIHMAKRYSNLDTTNPKVAKITTESRPVLQPCDVDTYFSYVVCDE